MLNREVIVTIGLQSHISWTHTVHLGLILSETYTCLQASKWHQATGVAAQSHCACRNVPSSHCNGQYWFLFAFFSHSRSSLKVKFFCLCPCNRCSWGHYVFGLSVHICVCVYMPARPQACFAPFHNSTLNMSASCWCWK